MPDTQIKNPNWLLQKLTITKNDVEFEIFPSKNKTTNIIEEFKFIRDINSTNMGGHLVIQDVYDWSDDLNINSFEELKIEFFTDLNYSQKKSISFKIFSVQHITHNRNTISVNEYEYFNLIKIDFSTDNILTTPEDFDLFRFGEDFVGYIATDGGGEVPGLMNEIFKKLGVEEYEIEPTYNGVWIKSNELSYPWSKSKGQQSLENILNEVKKYSCPKDNKNAINYFLWRDIDGYHFKSLEKIINDIPDELPSYYFLSEAGIPGGIIDVSEMRQANLLELSNSNTFQAFYEKITPNYEDYYLDFVDTSLSFKREVIDIDYNRDYENWNQIEKYKIISDDHNTSVSTKRLNVADETIKIENTIQNLRIDDILYGYQQESSLNTPFAQPWNHIGKTGDSRWDKVAFVPQYNMTDLDVKTFYTIHKKIREPLREKRVKYSYLKNLKRKWEVYRCSICCLSDRLGGIQDELDIARIRGVTNPQDNIEFKLLFGPTGIFGDLGVNYKVAAAGSFSDVYNYNSDINVNKGITLSYDLNSAPYNESISDFYHINPDFSNYEKHIFENGFKQYDTEIATLNKRLVMINEFLSNVDSYIQVANQVVTENLVDDPFRENFINNGPSIVDLDIVPPKGKWLTNSFSALTFNEETGTFDLPSLVFECSKQKIFYGDGSRVYTYQFDSDQDQYESYYTSFFQNFDYFNKFTDFNFNPLFPNPYTDAYNRLISHTNNKKAFCRDCINPVSLEVRKRLLSKQKIVIEQNIKLIQFIKTTLQEQFYEKWKQSKEEYLNRKAFFISKTEDKIKNIDENIISSNLSLFNIKSIQRKPVRGSRYEILARSRGITDNKIGEYLHKIYFNDEEVDISEEGNHPYYDQQYKTNLGDSSFQSLPNPSRLKSISDVLTSNDPPLGQYGQFSLGKLRGFIETYENNYNTQSLTDYGLGNRDFDYQQKFLNANFDNYGDRYNIFKTNLQDKKPPVLKREEISSYVRIEFKQPIGIESLSDFPEGFVRNAGYEYFLPYIVSLTAGPNGRQTINQNIVVIGMDPYGFDVAMKRISDYKQDGEYYWWWSGLDSPQMDLWPEVAFETKYPYYTNYEDNEYSNNSFFGLNENKDPFYVFDNNFYYTNDGIAENYNAAATDQIILDKKYNQSMFSYGIPEYSGFKYRNSKNSRYDKNLKNTNNCSSYFLNSNKVTKACRNWWSFHIPSNILIVPLFTDIFKSTNPINFPNFENITINNSRSIYGYDFYNEYDAFFNRNRASVDDKSLSIERNYEFSEILDAFDSGNINFFYENQNQFETVSVFKDNDTFKQIHPEIKAYFKEITNWWLSGDHIIYRPGLLSEDVWKYDLSGYTEYGMVFPPVKQNHGDVFDNNFAAQFVVFAKTTDICTKNNLKCINPNGFVTTSGCTAGNPYCNCPAQNRKPTEAEPSYLELYKLEQEIKECALIKEHLGEEWLGCVWSDPNNTASCNCPEIGDKFMEYLAYNRTYAMFWSTPPKTPLLRNTQMNLLYSNKMVIRVLANPNIKIGSIVNIIQPNNVPDGVNELKRFSGKYLVTSITYIFNGNNTDIYELTLNRDSIIHDPSEASEPVILSE